MHYRPALAALFATTAALAACGGSGSPTSSPAPAPPPAEPPTQAEAARFLSQVGMGMSRDTLNAVQSLGYAAWIDQQMSMPVQDKRWDWLVANKFDTATNKFSDRGFDNVAWRKLIVAPDVLRQRVTLALSELLVIGLEGLPGPWGAFSAANYLDLLEANAFGNYRTLLQHVSQNAAMGGYLTFKGNAKADPKKGSLPDENYARELLQLFTIGLTQLNLDGSIKLVNGQPQDTYTQDDVTGLARVFTGWDRDMTGTTDDSIEFTRRPMIQTAAKHESGSKTFLGYTVAAGADGAASLTQALDALFTHPNMAPFISRQLIQRLVTSNPTPAYIGRVAAVFNNDGKGVKGNLAAVVKTLLLDSEARDTKVAEQAGFGKLREPILRCVAWARTFGAGSKSGQWTMGNVAEPSYQLGQAPLRSPSVFNFFRPGYTPPGSAIGQAGMVAPEFQITNETSVVGYLNFMQRLVAGQHGDIEGSYSSLIPMADQSQTLIDEINLLLTGKALSSATLSSIKAAIDSMPGGTDSYRLYRVYATTVLMLASPEFIVQK